MQPGVSIAVRLVAATGVDVGELFQKFAEDNGLIRLSDDPIREMTVKKKIEFITRLHLPAEKLPKGTKSVFGVMFKEVRLHHGVTQKSVAEKARYHLRNLLNVESGQQEPGIMTALAMVCATGTDVKEFFDKLNFFLHGKHVHNNSNYFVLSP